MMHIAMHVKSTKSLAMHNVIYSVGKLHNSLSSRFMRGVRINRSSDT